MKKSLREKIQEIHDEIVESIKSGNYKAEIEKNPGVDFYIFDIKVDDIKVSIGVSAHGTTYYALDVISANVDDYYRSLKPVGDILTSEFRIDMTKIRIRELKAQLARLEKQEGGEQC